MWIKLYIMWIKRKSSYAGVDILICHCIGGRIINWPEMQKSTFWHFCKECHIKRLLGKQTKNYNNYKIYLSSNYVAAWCSTSFEMVLGNGKSYFFYIYTFICAAVFWSFQRQIDWNNLKICGKSTRMKLKKTWLLFKFFLLAGGTRSNAPVWDGFFDPRHHRD